jgi:hypothetical protein
VRGKFLNSSAHQPRDSRSPKRHHHRFCHHRSDCRCLRQFRFRHPRRRRVTILPLPLLANALSSPHPPSIPQRRSSPICDHNVPQIPALTSHTSHLGVLKLSSSTLTHYKPQIYSLSGSSSRAAPKPTLTASSAARMSPALTHITVQAQLRCSSTAQQLRCSSTAQQLTMLKHCTINDSQFTSTAPTTNSCTLMHSTANTSHRATSTPPLQLSSITSFHCTNDKHFRTAQPQT